MPKRKRGKKTDENRLTKRTMLRFEIWKAEYDWDDEVSEEHALLWREAIKVFHNTVIRIPRRIATGKITSVETHVFTDGSSQAARVKPIKDADKYTIPRMELLGVLVGARAIQFLHQEIRVMITATYLLSDSTIVLHQIADDGKIKDIRVENRLQEVRLIRDKYNVQFRHDRRQTTQRTSFREDWPPPNFRTAPSGCSELLSSPSTRPSGPVDLLL
ncbi:pao retrotransposon peptidase [Aphelenchoides avenae]|nr:pao retrotransposon peptidase [Aphelenchus avenae]